MTLECSVALDFEKHFEEKTVPTPVSSKTLIYPSQDIDYEREDLRGITFHEKVIRHPSSPVNTSNIGAETEIVHIGRKSHNECTVIIIIGARSQKA